MFKKKDIEDGDAIDGHNFKINDEQINTMIGGYVI